MEHADRAGLNWHLDYEASTGRVGLETVTRGASDPVASFDPTYDPAGNVTQMVQTLEGAGDTSNANPDNGTWTYHYDEASRLDSAVLDRDVGSDLSYAYCYDAAGNRLKTVACNVSGVTTTYDPAGLPISEGTKTFTHDGVGNLLKVESGGAVQSSYGFDAWGRLTSATAGSQQVSYVNDALGRTISRTQGTQTTALTYQGVGETLVREAGVQTIDYAQSPQGPLAQRVGSDVSFFLKNPHGDVVGTATSTSLSSSLAYSPYGELRGQAAGRLGYQGQMRDEATGLVDMTTRHYDPTMGRFISQDVLFGDLNSPMSMNQYGYAAGNPVTMWDPWGLAGCSTLDARCQGTIRVLDCQDLWDCVGKVAVEKSKDGDFSLVDELIDVGWDNGGSGFDPRSVPDVPLPPGVSTNRELLDGMGYVPHDEWIPLREALNHDVTLWALALANQTGGDCEYIAAERGWACFNVPSWVSPGHGGAQFGNVFLTPSEKFGDHDPVVDRDLRSHEFSGHADQWAYYGSGFPIALQLAKANAVLSDWGGSVGIKYGMADVTFGPSGDPDCNVFEEDAGYLDGGYTRCL